ATPCSLCIGLRAASDTKHSIMSANCSSATVFATRREPTGRSNGGLQRSSEFIHSTVLGKLLSAFWNSGSKLVSQQLPTVGSSPSLMRCPLPMTPKLFGVERRTSPLGNSQCAPPSLSAQYSETHSGHQWWRSDIT